MGEHGNTIDAFVDGLIERDGGVDLSDDAGVVAVIREVVNSDLLTMDEGMVPGVLSLAGDPKQVFFVLGPVVVDDIELAYTSIASVPVELADLADLMGEAGDDRGVLLTLVAAVCAEVSSLVPACERLYGKRAARGAIADEVVRESCEHSPVCPSCQSPWGEEHESFCSFPAWAEMFEDKEEG